MSTERVIVVSRNRAPETCRASRRHCHKRRPWHSCRFGDGRQAPRYLTMRDRFGLYSRQGKHWAEAAVPGRRRPKRRLSTFPPRRGTQVMPWREHLALENAGQSCERSSQRPCVGRDAGHVNRLACAKDEGRYGRSFRRDYACYPVNARPTPSLMVTTTSIANKCFGHSVTMSCSTTVGAPLTKASPEGLHDAQPAICNVIADNYQEGDISKYSEE